MGTHRRRQAVEPAPLEVVWSDAPQVTEGDAEQDVEPYEEPELYGVRVNWQSEAVRIEAAEFLVATRVQQDSRIRAAQELEVLRHSEPDHTSRTDRARPAGIEPAANCLEGSRSIR